MKEILGSNEISDGAAPFFETPLVFIVMTSREPRASHVKLAARDWNLARLKLSRMPGVNAMFRHVTYSEVHYVRYVHYVRILDTLDNSSIRRSIDRARDETSGVP